MARGETSREKILQAASELAFSEGAAHMTLDAIAARAGVSKGGLLYNFPNKTALMRALVQHVLDDFRNELNCENDTPEGGPLAARYVELVVKSLNEQAPPSSGLLAALAEDPCLLKPVKTFNRELLDRMKAGAKDPSAILVLFLVLEGLRAQMIFGTDILDLTERRILMEKITDYVCDS